MLPLRLAILAAVSGIALWGLFSLLDNLRRPQLLRSPNAILVKGCEPIESQEAVRLCPQLFCQKHLLDLRLVPRASRFEVTVDRREGATQLIGGSFRADPNAPAQGFACFMRHNKVGSARVLDTYALDILAEQSGDWEF